MTVVRMMGDTSLATVNRHYFNLDDEVMQEIRARAFVRFALKARRALHVP